MKTYKLIVAGLLGVALSIMPVYAQRNGGVSRSGGGHSTSVSRSSGGFSGSSRSSGSFSSSRSSSSYSSPRSSSSYSSSRNNSYSAPRSSSRSNYNTSRSNYNNNYGSPRSSYNSSRSSASHSYSTPRSSGSVNGTSAYRNNGNSSAVHRSSSPISRSAAMAASRNHSSVSNRSGSPVGNRNVNASRNVTGSRSNSGITNSRTSANMSNSRNGAISNTASRSNANGTISRNGAVNNTASRTGVAKGGRPGVDNGRPGGVPDRPLVNGYARPGHPGVLPPSSVPLRPAPYFYCPYYDAVMYMHLVPWYAPVVVRPIFWPGFWVYCNSYWYDYHPTDVVVVREYVDRTYGVDLISYAISGNYMYALVNDNDGFTYLQVFDENDHLLAEQQVHRKYREMTIDRDNGGCWISKKNGKDPLLFFYNDGQLLIYETE